MAVGFLQAEEDVQSAPSLSRKKTTIVDLFDPHLPETMIEVIRDPELRSCFRTFCEEQLAGENFHFWESVEKFQQIQDDEERLQFFSLIFDKYISLESDTELICSGPERKEIEEAKESGKVTAEVFDELQLQVWVSLCTELFPKFRASNFLTNLMELRHDPGGVMRSRRKLEDFFGMKIEGPLQRQDLIMTIQARSFSTAHKQKMERKKGKKLWRGKQRDPRNLKSHSVRTKSVPENCQKLLEKEEDVMVARCASHDVKGDMTPPIPHSPANEKKCSHLRWRNVNSEDGWSGSGGGEGLSRSTSIFASSHRPVTPEILRSRSQTPDSSRRPLTPTLLSRNKKPGGEEETSDCK